MRRRIVLGLACLCLLVLPLEADILRPGVGTGAALSWPLLAPDGTALAPSYSFADATGTGFFRDDISNSLQYAIEGLFLARMTPDGAWTGYDILGNTSYGFGETGGFGKASNALKIQWNDDGTFLWDDARLVSTATLGWNPDANPLTAADLKLGRDSAGVLSLTGTALQGNTSKAFVDEAATDIALVSIAASGAAAGTIKYGATSDVSLETFTGENTFACTNKADTETCDTDITATSATDADSTLSCVLSIDTDESNAVMFVLTCNEEAGDNGGDVYYRFDLLTSNAITAQ